MLTDPATPTVPFSSTTLSGRVAIVTGASSGIGAHAVDVLCRLGATVMASARRADRLAAVAAARPGCLTHVADLSVSGAPTALVETTLERAGRVDIVFANAATTSVTPALHEDDEAFARVVDMDLARTFELVRQAARAMRVTGGGSIVLVSSVVAHRVQHGVPTAAYTAAKSALAGLARELAVQWSRYGIRVNCIAPGVFPTEMTADLVDSEELRAAAISRIPLGRIGELTDLDGPIALLCSPAGSFITGHSLVVDGGWSL